MNTVPTSRYADDLRSGLAAIHCDLTTEVQQKLLAYHGWLMEWNQAYNLTGIRDPKVMIPQLILDALVALPVIQIGPIIDVGSGAGLPGLPLAISRPDLNFCLIDSNGKKTRFIKHVVTMLQLPNVDVVQSRVEAYTPAVKANWVVSRAFSSLAQFIQLTRHLLAPQGQWLAWKGDPTTELTEIGPAVELRQNIPVQLPGVSAARCLLVLAPK